MNGSERSNGQGHGWYVETSDSIKVNIFAIMAQTVEEGDLAGDWVFQWSDVSWYEVKAGKKITIMYHSAEKSRMAKSFLKEITGISGICTNNWAQN